METNGLGKHIHPFLCANKTRESNVAAQRSLFQKLLGQTWTVTYVFIISCFLCFIFTNGGITTSRDAIKCSSALRGAFPTILDKIICQKCLSIGQNLTKKVPFPTVKGNKNASHMIKCPLVKYDECLYTFLRVQHDCTLGKVTFWVNLQITFNCSRL